MNPHHPPHWRWLGAAALAVTAGVHIALVPAHLREAPYAGVLFMALSAAALALAVLLAATDDRLVWLVAAALSAAALLAYVASRWLGLPSMSDDVGDWLNPLGVVAAVSETAMVLMSFWVSLGRPANFRLNVLQ